MNSTNCWLGMVLGDGKPDFIGDPRATQAMQPSELPHPDRPDLVNSLPKVSGHFDPYSFLQPPRAEGELGRLGPYRVLKLLGAGAMGLVFQAQDIRASGRLVALKVMKPELASNPAARARFFREARAVAALDHENIVTIYPVGEEGGFPFIAMQLLKGQSLDDRRRESKPLGIDEVLRLGRQIALGLAAAHEADLMHRDVKPANLWLEQGGRLKILDFGLSRPVVDDARLTQSGAIIGTPAYLAPEQARGDKIDSRCDLFSLGIVLFELCTGRLPFAGGNSMAILIAVAMESPLPMRAINPAVPPELEDLVMHLLAKDPEERPPSAREVANRLAAIEEHRPGHPDESPPAPALQGDSPPTSPPPMTSPPESKPEQPTTQSWRSRRWVFAAVVLAGLPLGWFFGGQAVRFARNQGSDRGRRRSCPGRDREGEWNHDFRCRGRAGHHPAAAAPGNWRSLSKTPTATIALSRSVSPWAAAASSPSTSLGNWLCKKPNKSARPPTRC